MGLDKVRVGLISYSTSAQVSFHLDKYSNKSDILHAISSMVQKGGATYTNEGLDKARTEVFTTKHGKRYRQWRTLCLLYKLQLLALALQGLRVVLKSFAHISFNLLMKRVWHKVSRIYITIFIIVLFLPTDCWVAHLLTVLGNTVMMVVLMCS